ncbi:LacI family DNA-binding transcriptional regulator [Prauserella muralis]|uniref:Transcriptional regulator LacI/GalR-like sensor domain-containing protein n=1 Tax=Prauserella muralis TaxID=588067 RepID=A0A2V4B8D8_9PSEU|nr:substrate-binding domain-containing protein [Prauserella muralis]PXY31510.1 hypothetical protein BAY60_03810 [Prauserella muralis]TWE14141.1 LacI family transcriptional regulator [Prauserella muralis]
MSAPSDAPPLWDTPVAYRLGVAIAPCAGDTELADAVDEAARAAGCAATFAEATSTVAAELAAVRALRAQGVDGVILLPAPGSDTVITELLRLGTPTVLVEHIATRDDVDQVATENVQSTIALVEHLASLGHRRIAFVGGPAGYSATDERALGYRLGLGRAGLPWEGRLVGFAGAGGDAGAAAERVLAQWPEPSALVVADSSLLPAVRHQAWRRGLRIGEGLALACHGHCPATPPITAMTPSADGIARTAVRLLLARLGDPGRRPETVRLPPRFDHHRTCGCLS